MKKKRFRMANKAWDSTKNLFFMKLILEFVTFDVNKPGDTQRCLIHLKISSPSDFKHPCPRFRMYYLFSLQTPENS